MVGEDVDPAQSGRTLSRAPARAKQREVRGAAAHVHDQPDRPVRVQRAAGDRGGLGLGHELDLAEARGEIAAAQIVQRLPLARVVRAVKHHRPPRQRAVEGQARLGLGPRFHVRQEAGDDVHERHALVQDLPPFVHERCAQHPLQRPHEPPLDPVQKRAVRRLADQRAPGLVVEEEGGGQRGLSLTHADQARPAAVQEPRRRIRGAEVDPERGGAGGHGTAPAGRRAGRAGQGWDEKGPRQRCLALAAVSVSACARHARRRLAGAWRSKWRTQSDSNARPPDS